MTGPFTKPSDVTAMPVRDAGGDNEVPRDKTGRPRIKVPCTGCDGSGRIPSEKRPGNTVKCPKGCVDGQLLRSFTRVTTYIDVLDDKSNLEAWQMRMVLVGAAKEPELLCEVEDLHAQFLDLEQQARTLAGEHDVDARLDEIDAKKKSIKDELNRRAQIAKQKAGAEDKADKGTELHGLSELVDLGQALPAGAAFGDVIDMDAYRTSTRGLKIVHMEKLVVNDEIKAAGTPDRVSEWWGELYSLSIPELTAMYGEDGLANALASVTPLTAPDGHEFRPGELMITDLKTGTVEYGALKMAMQLAIYANSLLYDKDTGERVPLGNINLDWGLIMNVPAGTGTAQLYWADLRLGWRAVKVAGDVRELRALGKKALIPVSGTSLAARAA